MTVYFTFSECSLLLLLQYTRRLEIEGKLNLWLTNKVEQTLLVNSICYIFQGNNPFISVMLNDGNQIYDHNKYMQISLFFTMYYLPKFFIYF